MTTRRAHRVAWTALLAAIALAAPAIAADAGRLRPVAVGAIDDDALQVASPGKQENGVVVADTSGAAAGAQATVLRSRDGLLKGGERYRVRLSYRILREPKNRSEYLYVLVKSTAEGGKWYPTIEMQGKVGEPAGGSYEFLVPPDGKPYVALVGLRGPGRVAIDAAVIERLPRIGDVPAGATVSDLPLPLFDRPYEPYGMCTHADRLWSYTDEEVEQAVPMWAAAGIQWVRIGLPWSGFEPTEQGGWNPKQVQRVDRLLQLCEQHGVKAYAIIGGLPKWASMNPDSKMYWAFEPKDLGRFQAFLRFVTQRYGKRIDFWELGNEPNWAFWQSGMPAYMRWARAGAEVIRQEDPGAQIINGGFADAGLLGVRIGEHLPNPSALQEMAALGFRDVFDVMAVHVYGDDPEGLVHTLNGLYAQMHELGVADMPIWVNETGYSTVGGRTEAQQAQWIADTYDLLLKHPSVEKVFYYNFKQKVEENKTGGDSREANFGIVRGDLSPRPAYDAFRDMPKRTSPEHDPALLAVDRWKWESAKAQQTAR